MKYIRSALYISFVVSTLLETVISLELYRLFYLEDPHLCSEITKRKIKLGEGPGSGLIVKQKRLSDHSLPWTQNYKCSFQVNALQLKNNIVVVIQYLNLRKNELTGECIDYVQFKSQNGHTSQKFCGRFNAELIMDSFFLPEPTLGYLAINNTFIDTTGGLTVYVIISKEPLNSDEERDINIVFTTFQSCLYSPPSYKPCRDDIPEICIYNKYFYDDVINCPYVDCVDEGSCTQNEAHDEKTSIGNKVLIGSVTSLFLIFLIFITCLYICRKYGKLCWSSDFANPGSQPQQSQPTRVIELNESPTQSQNILPTAPVPSAENQEDKDDLPPSYESLFPPR